MSDQPPHCDDANSAEPPPDQRWHWLNDAGLASKCGNTRPYNGATSWLGNPYPPLEVDCPKCLLYAPQPIARLAEALVAERAAHRQFVLDMADLAHEHDDAQRRAEKAERERDDVDQLTERLAATERDVAAKVEAAYREGHRRATYKPDADERCEHDDWLASQAHAYLKGRAK